MAKAVSPTPRMTVDRVVAWLEEGPDGAGYEFVAGEVVAMAPERAAHARLKAGIWRALDDQIGGRGQSAPSSPVTSACRTTSSGPRGRR
jgi:hypothetical protein